MNIQNKKLYRSDENKIIFGIFGGLGEYFEIDPVLIRVFYIIIGLFSMFFPAIIAYILMAFVVPKKPEIIKVNVKEENKDENK